jgi:hypothetical protein
MVMVKQNHYNNSRAILYVEPLQELYLELKSEVMLRQRTGTKAERIRLFISNLSDYLGDRRLCLDATYNLAQIRIEGLARGYFTNIVRKTWTTDTDSNGVEWIKTDHPKGRWHK